MTKYTKVGIRLEPDKYNGDTEQGWWDDEHWAKFKHLVPPYETMAKWCQAIKERNGVPYTYLQIGMPSDDYARAFPGHMLFNDNSRLGMGHIRPSVSFDYTDPDFQAHMLSTFKRLRKEGMGGIKFDYPEFGWHPEGGFENRYATTAFAYREIFRVVREGLGPDAFVNKPHSRHQRNSLLGPDSRIGGLPARLDGYQPLHLADGDDQRLALV